MIYRLLYKLWVYFWVTVGALAGVAALLIVLGGIALQLPQSKEYIKNEVTDTFNRQFSGHLEIDELRGLLPFSIEVVNGKLFAPEDSIQPVISFNNANVSIDWWELIRQNVSISSFEVSEPEIWLAKNQETLNLASAFSRRTATPFPGTDDITEERLQIFNQVNILAPYLGIIDGRITLDESLELPPGLNIPSPYVLDQVNSTLFLEISENQIFADVLEFEAPLGDNVYEYLRGSGQLYADIQFFELNRVRLYTAMGELQLSVEANPVNIFTGDITGQFRQADYRAVISNSSFSPNFIKRFLPAYPSFQENLELEVTAQGTLEQLFVDRFQATIGQSSVLMTASLTNLLAEQLAYDLQLENIVLNPAEMQFLSDSYLDSLDVSPYNISILRGDIIGDLNSINTDLSLQTDRGALSLDSYFSLNGSNEFEALAELDSLDITVFVGDSTQTTILNGLVAARGAGFSVDDRSNASLDLKGSRIFGYDFNQMIGEFQYSQNRLNYSLFLDDYTAEARGEGYYFGRDGYHDFSINGNVVNLDLAPYPVKIGEELTRLTGSFNATVEGSTIDDLFGRVSIEMEESVIDSDTLRAHQLYADINSPNEDNRILRFTSSFFDGELSGRFSPESLNQLSIHWANYFEDKLKEEILFNREFEFAERDSVVFNGENPEADLSFSLLVKDLDLLRSYAPDLPLFSSRARISANLNASRDRLSISANISDQNFEHLLIGFENFNSSFTASFDHQSDLKEFNTINFQANSSAATFRETTLNESFITYSMSRDSLELQQNFVRDDGVSLSSSMNGVLRSDEIELSINRLEIGSESYTWRTLDVPGITYTNTNALTVDQFRLTSDDDLFEVNGTFSSNVEDSVDYLIKNFNISRISDVIGGRVRFSGILDGDFTTRSLGQIPSIQGTINVDNGQINGRTVGDLSLNSTFNPDLDRFDTDVRIYTDPEKYSSYLEGNNGVGKDLRLNGYFKLPDDVIDGEDLFYFDADLQEIDMWIVSLIVPVIIEEMQGSSSGTGFIRGSRDDYDFDATFQISDVYGTPLFLNTGFTLNGELDFSRTDGLIFRDIILTDSQGGSGTLSGDIDLDDFSPDTFLNLTLDMNNLHFMNNQYDADVPFYATLFGTGQASITGSNLSPFLQTNTPMILSSNSRVSIPLEEETEFEQDRRFIQFVDTFDLSLLNQRREESERDAQDSDPVDLTFVERFTMDLQFIANDPVNVQLIFDRVTNEVLSANGTGQVRILLEDQDVSMFGRFNIQSGDYQFVSGDIFTRRFTLEEGGSISWQGDLVDANLNVTATYRARPTISSLLSTSITSSPIGESGQRIPVDLVLQIGGTITAVENDFFFRVPTGIEGTLDPALAAQINNLNQSEQDKLYQATGILLSGNFLPPLESQDLLFGDSITGTTAVVNPLLTSQVINPLLSNQINSLLRSDITFDIDLNLTAFNEVDLGVALRLFNDRVILRREGQITGEQSDIGDIGATYRINRTFSLTAFHRQDPTLSYTSGVDSRQTQEMNGMGLEAQVQFNTWKDFRNRISNAFKRLFGIKSKDEQSDDEESIAQN